MCRLLSLYAHFGGLLRTARLTKPQTLLLWLALLVRMLHRRPLLLGLQGIQLMTCMRQTLRLNRSELLSLSLSVNLHWGLLDWLDHLS